MDAVKANGELGSNLPLNVECRVALADRSDDDPKLLQPSYSDASTVTDAMGRLGVTYPIPADAKTLMFKVNQWGEIERERRKERERGRERRKERGGREREKRENHN